MLLGVSGSWEDSEVTSLPEDVPKEPDSEKETWGSSGGEAAARPFTSAAGGARRAPHAGGAGPRAATNSRG